MNERLLQYIWQFQCYNRSALITEEGESLLVIHPGHFNANQGPDFLDARIKIGLATWAGSVELHINASGWTDHGHSEDKNYENVILHVVWKQDANLKLPFQTLVLENRVSKLLLGKYEELMLASGFIPCEKSIRKVDKMTWDAWKDRLLTERLQVRTATIFSFLKENNNHWEECFWWLLARNFGLKLNSEAFLALARSIPFNILAKHKGQIHQLEAILFGQSGLLDGQFNDDYPKLLQHEFRLLKRKYSLQPIHIPLLFMRMRPSGFPSLRLAQLAMLLKERSQLFTIVRAFTGLDELAALLDVTADDYWHCHYVFDESSVNRKKSLGRQMAGNIIINTIVPMVFAYGVYHDEDEYREKAIRWLEQAEAEKNTVTRGFEKTGIPNSNAFDSQALLQLKNEYCNHKRCLECAIGNRLLKVK